MARPPHPIILVVEDQPEVRRFVVGELRVPGYEVIEAQGGLEGMAAVLSSQSEIPLAIVDLVMPGVSGLDFANQLQVDRPKTKILYTSGFRNSVAVETIRQRAPSMMLDKPFTAGQLLGHVRELLGVDARPPS